MTGARYPQTIIAASPGDAAAVLDLWREQVHLVAACPSVPALPWGCGVLFTFLDVDPDPAAGQVRGVDGGRLALTGWTLDRIGAALGVVWDDRSTRRLDDRSEPHLAAYRAIGHYRAFDGSWIQIMGDADFDLRDGAPQIRVLRSEGGRGWQLALDRQRAHLDESVRDGARTQALRAAGVRPSYLPEELSNPFLVARVLFLGRPMTEPDAAPTEASRLAMHAALAIMTSWPPGCGPDVAGVASNLGVRACAAPAVVAGVSAGPPPDAPAAAQAAPVARRAPKVGRQTAADPPGASGGNDGGAMANSLLGLFGRDTKGKMLADMTDDRLNWYLYRIETGRTGGAEISELHAASVRAELHRRGLKPGKA